MDGNHARSPGAVMTVLTIAMITSMVKTGAGITPSSNPRFTTTSSISALVFIMMAMFFASSDFNPDSRAAI